jgi:eukaryotic-like serine/threonine-protein kinase
MDSARWEQVQALFHDTVALPESQRQAFLAATCRDDEGLMAEVLAMLKADGRGASILDRGLHDVAYSMVGAPLEVVSLREFGPYRLKKLLGEGGMGVVWLAERADAGNLVAIKFLPHAGLSPARRERFAREIKTLGKLRHPFIARLYDAGTLDDGTPWFVMEFVEGLRFTEYCRNQDRPIEDRLRLFRMVCQAVQYAHSQEIIHRDLKPSNILVEPDGTPRLLDFGIARELQSLDDPADQTRPGLQFMSRDYAAPEWVRDGSVGFYTDVYSLGVMLYETLAGRLPLDRPEKPTAGTKWNDLDVLCLKAMHQEAHARYQSVEAFIRDIDHYLKGEPLEARPDSLTYRLRKFVTRNRHVVVAAAFASALVVSLIVFFTLRLARARDRADRETAIASAMNRFLSDDLLGQSDPFKSGQAKKAFVDVVNQASSHIDLQFRTEPVVAARLHQTIARAFDNGSDFARARQEYARANDLFKQGEGPLSPEAMVVRFQRAAMEARSYQPGSLALAKSLVSEAAMSIPRMAQPREDLTVWLQYTRGVIALVDNDPHSANGIFLEALRLAQPIPAFDDAARRRIKQLLAFSYVHLGDGAKAESLFRELIQASSKTLGPDSPEVLRSRIQLAGALLIQGKYAAAIEEANLVYPTAVSKLGEDHEAVMTLLGTRAASEGSLAMWDDAIRDDLTVYHLAVRKLGPISYYSIGMLSDAALSQCRVGRYAEGESNARKAFQAAKQAFGPRAGATGGTSYALATCLIGMNRLPEASELLRDLDVKAIFQQTGDSTIGAGIALAQGEIAARRGDYTLARSYAQTAAPAFDRPNADVSQKQSLQKLRKAIDAHLQPSR